MQLSNALDYAARLSSNRNKGPVGSAELVDSLEDVYEKTAVLLQYLQQSSYVVVHTGAGVSTSCGIPDFRGPSGVWTLEAKEKSGQKSLETAEATAQVVYGDNRRSIVAFSRALPSKTHLLLKELVKRGFVKYIITQNIDCLHARCGTPFSSLAEVHGNMFMERCDQCGRRYMRDFGVPTISFSPTGHLCGLCSFPPSGHCTDTLLDWYDKYEEFYHSLSLENSQAADFHLCMGSSLQIQPAVNFPGIERRADAKLAIVNYQKAALYNEAHLNIHGDVDTVCQQLAERMGISDISFTRRTLIIILRVPIGSVPPDVKATLIPTPIRMNSSNKKGCVTESVHCVAPSASERGENGGQEGDSVFVAMQNGAKLMAPALQHEDALDWLKEADSVNDSGSSGEQIFIIRGPCISSVESTSDDLKVTSNIRDPLRGVWIVRTSTDCDLSVTMWYDKTVSLSLVYSAYSTGLAADIWKCAIAYADYSTQTDSNHMVATVTAAENGDPKHFTPQYASISSMKGDCEHVGSLDYTIVDSSSKESSLTLFRGVQSSCAPTRSHALPQSFKAIFDLYSCVKLPANSYKMAQDAKAASLMPKIMRVHENCNVSNEKEDEGVLQQAKNASLAGIAQDSTHSAIKGNVVTNSTVEAKLFNGPYFLRKRYPHRKRSERLEEKPYPKRFQKRALNEAFEFEKFAMQGELPDILLQLRDFSNFHPSEKIHCDYSSELENFNHSLCPVFLPHLRIASDVILGDLTEKVPSYVKPIRRWVSTSAASSTIESESYRLAEWTALKNTISYQYGNFVSSSVVKNEQSSFYTLPDTLRINCLVWQELRRFPLWCINLIADLFECR